MLLIVRLKFREEVGTAVKAINVGILAEVKVMAGIVARQFNAHHILGGRKMEVRLAVVRYLPACFTCIARAAIPHKEGRLVYNRMCGRRSSPDTVNKGEEKESHAKQGSARAH